MRKTFVLLCGLSLAGFTNGASYSPDPFTDCAIVNTSFNVQPNTGTSGKTVASSVIDTTKVNVVLIIAGQSNNANSFPSLYTPTNTGKVFNFNVEDGANYNAADPLLGTSNGSVPTVAGQGNFAGRLADALINAGTIQNVYLVPIAIGGTSAADWEAGKLGSGCSYHSRFVKTYNRLAARGIVPGLTNTTIAILWGHGEQDQASGTSQAAYAASLSAIIAASRAAGFTQGSVPWFVNTETWNGGAVSSAIVAAQSSVVNHSANIWAGFNMDGLNAANRQTDNTHLNDTGSAAYATGMKTSLSAYGAPF